MFLGVIDIEFPKVSKWLQFFPLNVREMNKTSVAVEFPWVNISTLQFHLLHINWNSVTDRERT
jgi:hypothetical protein